MESEKRLNEQIMHLEHREKEGVALLKQADCMWTCMEDAYKKKIAESTNRQNELNTKVSFMNIIFRLGLSLFCMYIYKFNIIKLF